MNSANTTKRWYDRNYELAQSVRLLMLLPLEIQNIVCEGVMMLANREFRIHEKMESFKTLGAEKITGLHKSKNRRREYDVNNITHKTMNYFYILSDENQDVMAEHILAMMAHIRDYLATIKAFSEDVDLEDVAKIIRTYVEKGSTAVKEYISDLRHRFYRELLAATGRDDLPMPPMDFIEDITSLRIIRRE